VPSGGSYAEGHRAKRWPPSVYDDTASPSAYARLAAVCAYGMRLIRYTLRLPSRGVAPAHRLQVRNTTVRSRSHAIKFGSNTDTEMSEILFDNVTITVPCPALPCPALPSFLRAPSRVRCSTLASCCVATRCAIRSVRGFRPAARPALEYSSTPEASASPRARPVSTLVPLRLPPARAPSPGRP
jgi:hypothetical protein